MAREDHRDDSGNFSTALAGLFAQPAQNTLIALVLLQEFAIQTVCAFTKVRGPKCESSRPYPLFLTPPTGTRRSDDVTPLMKTPPV